MAIGFLQGLYSRVFTRKWGWGWNNDLVPPSQPIKKLQACENDHNVLAKWFRSLLHSKLLRHSQDTHAQLYWRFEALGNAPLDAYSAHIRGGV